MKLNAMYLIISLFWVFILISTQPISAQTHPVKIKTNLAFFSERFFGIKNGHRYSDKGITKVDLKYDVKNLSSQFSINYNEGGEYTLDGSYLQYAKGIATFGIGAIDRNWSFSNNSSLILSHNARPSKSIYLTLKNRFEYDWLPLKANWSFEIFDGFIEGSLKNTQSKITGIRATISPIDRLDFELLQTSQWGGEKYSNGISALGSALFLDSNNSSNANINKMAGFGISYSIPNNKMPLRVYGQVIGEDEAGSLPSCFSYLAGVELSNSKIKYPTVINFETIDTRIDATTHNNCGPNTMYNNMTYKYTNYGKSMGTSIDTEGTSLGLYVRSQISKKINIDFATKLVVINDNNWSGHRLSSNRQSGFINSFGVSWVKSNFTFNGDVYNQAFNLNKVNIKSGYGFGFSSSITF